MKRVGVMFLSMLIAAGAAFAADPAPQPAAKAPKETPELVAKGKAAYAVNCLMCHGEAGDGNGPAGQALNPKPRDFAKDPFKQGSKPEEVFKTLTEGVQGTPMVGYAHLPDEDRWALTYYVLSFVPKNAKKDAKPAPKAAGAKK